MAEPAAGGPAVRRGWVLSVGVSVLRPPLRLFTKRDWRGAEFIPATGGCVLAVNHISHFDPLVVGHFVTDHGRSPRFLGKAELFAVPVLGKLLVSAGQIPVQRRVPDAATAFGAAVAAVQQGECVVVYPEGTITRDPALWPMRGKTGAVRISLATGCPIIPVAQWGAQDVLAPYSHRLRLVPRKAVHVFAGAPVDLSDLFGQPITPALLLEGSARVTAAITGLLSEIRGEPAPERPVEPPGRFDATLRDASADHAAESGRSEEPSS